MLHFHKLVKPRKTAMAIFAAICAAALTLPQRAHAVQIVPDDYEQTFCIRFSGYGGGTTLTDFPVLVKLSKALNDFRY